ncbi:SDR family NAD(P)-dependent oxidoreductase [Janthinobacterium sp. 17J80-10]|uniref:SDR family NAD(P)-dependent oxidoreductase n=1 Tax=Janthinobacterium sp. 17J80-10 TaxID=2497863 RepID=UPI00100537EE|nr:SDR family NAD(P)-dependent oxidoreductase [Janthinobacterium sp. 17J80-10]QAU34388.1 SDR family NAD(P)-dependent oxidoreductase [Janthinobacterium sp. 17J80-10]
MKDLKGKVAVVTGAASGIGLGLAKRALEEGMCVVLAGIRESTLAAARDELSRISDQILVMPTDVSKAEDVEALANAAFEHFGGVHLLINNAGVGGGGSVASSTLADWEWMIGVNLWGVIHGIRSFVPRMAKLGEPCHVVNTASIAGLITYPGGGVYQATKHAVVALSEALHMEMQAANLPVGVSVLCPGFVRTQIMASMRNRPQALANPPANTLPTPQQIDMHERFKAAIENGMDPAEVAEQTFSAIREKRFYVMTHPEHRPQIAARMENILAERNPSFQPAGA